MSENNKPTIAQDSMTPTKSERTTINNSLTPTKSERTSVVKDSSGKPAQGGKNG